MRAATRHSSGVVEQAIIHGIADQAMYTQAFLADLDIDLLSHLSEVGYMAANPTNRISEIRRARGWSQQRLAEEVGAHWITVSKLERGRMQLTGTWLDKLSAALGVHASDLLPKKIIERTVELFGSIKEGGRVLYYEDGLEHPVSMPQEIDFFSMWFEVEGESLWPIFQDGDMLRFFTVTLEEMPEYLGRLCILRTEDESSYIGFLDMSAGEGTFDLRPISAPPLRELKPKDAAVIYEARFTPPWERIEE